MDGKGDKKAAGGLGGGATKESIAQQQQQQQPVAIERILKEVVGPMLQEFCGSLTGSVEKLVARIEHLETKVDGNRRVSRGGGGAEAASAGEFQDGTSFFAQGLWGPWAPCPPFSVQASSFHRYKIHYHRRRRTKRRCTYPLFAWLRPY